MKRKLQCSGPRSTAELELFKHAAETRAATRDMYHHEVLLPFETTRPSRGDITDEARAFFMANYAGNPGLDLDDNRGITELFPTDSRVSLARDVLALQFFANWHRRKAQSTELQIALAKSLSDLRASVCLYRQSSQASIIATILLLQATEYATAFVNMREATYLHLDGAVALIEQRGIENFRSRTDRHILACVQHASIRRALVESKIPHPSSILWNRPIKPFASGDGILDPIAYQVALLRNRFYQLEDSYARSSSGEASRTANEIILLGWKLESTLKGWASHQPSYLYPTLISDSSHIHSSIARAGLFRNTCEVHYNIETARIWNTHRQLLLYVYQTMIASTGLHGETWLPKEHAELCERASAVIDAICFSVPYFLGNKQGGNHISDFTEIQKLRFPCRKPETVEKITELAEKDGAGPQASRREYLRQANALSGWPLFRTTASALTLLGLESYRFADLARASRQQRWLQSQHKRVIALFDLRSHQR